MIRKFQLAGSSCMGATEKQVVIRAIGPSLAGAGVSGALSDPMLELWDSSGA